jgi:CubicO group peptidase (beta-lactamase class C family)
MTVTKSPLSIEQHNNLSHLMNQPASKTTRQHLAAQSLALCLSALTLLVPLPQAAASSPEELCRQMQSLVDQQLVVGAQILVGRKQQPLAHQQFGTISPNSDTAVDSSTVFCIGSCSKPIASTCLLALTDKNVLNLDDTVDKWLPQFTNLKLTDGTAVETAPTLRQLLCHRAGIYSQRRTITPQQARLLYQHDHTLQVAIDGIATQPLIAQPGSEYAYSGAGYCILGKAAEVAASKDFDQLVQTHICQPLNMTHTTYFPGRHKHTAAAGGSRQNQTLIANPTTPHLADPHRMLLVGGSLYSNTTDLSRFAQMITNQGATPNGRILSPQAWQDLSRQQYLNQSYGLGWRLIRTNGTLTELSHSGSLASSKALLRIHLPSQSYVIVLYTLTTPQASNQVSTALNQTVRSMIDTW